MKDNDDDDDLEWQYSTAATIWWNFLLARPSDMRPCRAMYSEDYHIESAQKIGMCH